MWRFVGRRVQFGVTLCQSATEEEEEEDTRYWRGDRQLSGDYLNTCFSISVSTRQPSSARLMHQL